MPIRTPVEFLAQPDGTKKCRKCFETKRVDQFPVRPSSQDGYRPNCKACKKAQHDEWMAANRERTLNQRREHYAANRERIRAERKQQWSEDPERFRAQARQRYWKNPDKYRTKQKQWRAQHPGYDRPLIDRWVEKNRLKVRAYYHRRRAAARGLRIVKYDGSAVAARWAMWGYKCYICSAPAEASDHVKPISRGGLDIPANLRPICHRCNSSKQGDWLGIEMFGELIDWVRDGAGPMPPHLRALCPRRTRFDIDDAA